MNIAELINHINPKNYPKGALVLGNGESINLINPLSKWLLEDYLLIGVNRIGYKLQPHILFIGDPPFNDPIIRTTHPQYYVTNQKYPWDFNPDQTFEFEEGQRDPPLQNLRLNTILDLSYDSPYMAIQLAYKIGFRKIYLLGVDYTPNHFYKEDGDHQCIDNFEFIDKAYSHLFTVLSNEGIILRNLSPKSRLTGIPQLVAI